MGLIIGVVLLGLALGMALGGSLRNFSEARFRWWPLAFVGLALQLVPVPSVAGLLDHWVAVGLLISSYVVLLAFVVANIRAPGFPLLAAGFALNFLVISVNAGMPVSDSGLRKAFGPDYREMVVDLTRHGGAKHHLARPSDVLLPLADVIPVGAPVHQVLSVGDILWLAGAVWVIAAATKGSGGAGGMARRRSREVSEEGEPGRRSSRPELIELGPDSPPRRSGPARRAPNEPPQPAVDPP